MGENDNLDYFKYSYIYTDTEKRKIRYQIGLVTLVVFSVKYECLFLEFFWKLS
jgi:hypothetical protein